MLYTPWCKNPGDNNLKKSVVNMVSRKMYNIKFGSETFNGQIQNITISQNTTKIIVLCFKICFTTTCFSPFL